LIRLAIRVRREHAELVLAELLELAPSGVEEATPEPGVVEYAVYGPPGELPALPDLRAAVGGALVEISTEEIADDWAERWREFHKPLVLDGALTVRPPWEAPGSTPIDLVIDPGQAFGTGGHATTRLCLELMVSQQPSGAFLDLGCGSGVLAIAAAALGYEPVLAVDNDEAGLRATRANALVNGVRVEVRRADVRRDALPGTDTVAANLLAPLLISSAATLDAAGPRRIIASGILVPEASQVVSAFARRGFTDTHRRVQGDWVALLLER
jgi:ribosomal protein L11 methyltransferase